MAGEEVNESSCLCGRPLDSGLACSGCRRSSKECICRRPQGRNIEEVDHPRHYGGDTTYEVVKVAEAWGLDKDAYLFSVLKYIARAGKKDPDKTLVDLEKSRWYLDRRIKLMKESG